MIWLWLYLGSVVPVILFLAFLTGRYGGPPTIDGPYVNGPIFIGLLWPVVLPVFAFVEIVRRVIELGESQQEKSK